MGPRDRRALPHVFPNYSFLSSSGVKELAIFGGEFEQLVPATVAKRLRGRLQRDENEVKTWTFSSSFDKLDDTVHNAKQVPWTDTVRGTGEIYEILDQMRATLPRRSRQARWIVKERQEMIRGETRGRADHSRGPREPTRLISEEEGCARPERQGRRSSKRRGRASVRSAVARRIRDDI